MLKRHLTGSDYFIIAANLVPLYGVLFLDWSAASMFLVYCMETLIVGLFNVIKMAIVNIFAPKDDNTVYFNDKKHVGRWYLVFFFIIHYGLFVFIQTQIFFHAGNLIEDNSFIVGYSKVIDHLGPDGRLVLLVFICSYALQTIYSFLIGGQYRSISLGRLMFQPYARILIQQFVVILGSMFLTLGGGKFFMVVFVIIKIIFEVYINVDKYLQVAEEKELRRSVQ